MRRSLAVVVALLVACKGNEAEPADTRASGTSPAIDPFEQGLVDLEALRARMCACSDVPCTEKVFDDFKAWRLAVRTQNPGKRGTQAQEQRGATIDRAMKACRSSVTAKIGSAAAPPKDVIEAGLAELDAFKSKMCACKDKACADAVQTDFATWQRNLRTKLVDKPDKPDERQAARTTKLEAEMAECRKKAETGTPGPGAAPKIEAMLVKLQGFRDKICACTTKDCATKLQAERKLWQEQISKDSEIASAKPTKDQGAKAARLDGEIKTCTLR